MALDYLAFEKIIKLIGNEIVNGKITKINQISNEEFLFVIRNNNQNHNLIISTHPNMSYINLAVEKIESNHQTSNLLMVFRKHLENGKVISFNQANEDRIVIMEVENKDDYYNINIKKVCIELIGRASNIILTGNDDKIIDSLKKIPLEYSNLRTIQPNVKYTMPDKPQVTNIPYDIENEMKFLNISYEEIVDRIKKSNEIYITCKDNKKDFHFIPFTYLLGEVNKYRWNEGLEIFFKNSLQDERHRQYTFKMQHLAKNEIKKNEKKIDKLKQELQVNKDATIYKNYGDLLLTYCQNEKEFGNEIEVFDEIENRKVKIKVDPSLDIFKNANNYYKKYQKSKTAVIKIQEQIDICNSLLEYFNSINYALSNASYQVAQEIQEELSLQGFLKTQKKTYKTNKKSKVKEKVYHPLCYLYKDIKIYVGQNNLQNEYLTFKIAAKNHLFFHVQQGPGAHVVVSSDKVSNDIIKVAANLAAYYSSFEKSSTVAVNYTLVKNVKKIPGGKPGKVIINQQKTIYVDPSFDEILKLKKLD